MDNNNEILQDLNDSDIIFELKNTYFHNKRRISASLWKDDKHTIGSCIFELIYPDIDTAMTHLKINAVKYFPDSDFAKKYGEKNEKKI